MSMRAAVPFLASAQLTARPNSTLNFRVTRELLKHKDAYNNSIRPFLQGLSSHTHDVLRYLPPHLLNLCRDEKSRQFLPLEQVMRKPLPLDTPTISSVFDGSIADQAADPDPRIMLGMEALNTFHLLEERLAMTEHKSLLSVPYEFNIGDLVVHKDLRQLGVVAARLPVCLESESWVTENIGSMQDRRMAHPWYLIMVAHHAGLPLDFVRYGSQLTHAKMSDSASKPIGFHRLLPLYFQGYDMEEGRYIPRGKLPVKQKTTQQQHEEALALDTESNDVQDDEFLNAAEAEAFLEQKNASPTTVSLSANSSSRASKTSSTSAGF